MNTHRDGDRLLQLLIFNEEFLVVVDHQSIAITSLPFVHTARRSYRLSNPVSISDRECLWQHRRTWKVKLTLLLRGRRSRNKVSVGEPAEGSIIRFTQIKPSTYMRRCSHCLRVKRFGVSSLLALLGWGGSFLLFLRVGIVNHIFFIRKL